jgi:hypothetical protein
MKPQTTKALSDSAMLFVAAGASEYLRKHGLTADPAALAECCASWARAKLGEALADARESIEAGMHDAAAMTFGASMYLAGIEAAKEASQ